MIIGINTILKLIIVKIIDMVGCDTQSSEMSFVMMSIFFTTLFNTGFLLLFVNGNMQEQHLFPGHRLLTGDLSDFNREWFDQMGPTICGSMRLNCVMPIILEVTAACIRGAKRLLDYLKRGKGTNTATKTIQAYINLYAGPEYLLHAKYSSILTITYISMIYGAGMPILFPIAAISLFVLFVVEKYCIYYVYKAPPAYDEKLNNKALKVLSFAPLFCLGFGFWILTNMQLIHNDEMTAKEHTDQAYKSNHYWLEFLTSEGRSDSGGAMLLIILFFIEGFRILFGTPVGAAWNALISSIGNETLTAWLAPGLVHDELELDEDIELYQNCLDLDDRHWTIAEENNSRKFGIQTIMKETYDDIRDGHLTDDKYHLEGVHTYDILRNPLYQQAFQYYSADLIGRKDYIVDGDDDDTNDCAQSDLVRIILNLAFLPHDDVIHMSFDPAGLHMLEEHA